MPSIPWPFPDRVRANVHTGVLTPRGVAVIGLVGLGVLAGLAFGQPALNAVVVPGAILLGVALWRVREIDRPSVTRTCPTAGTIGDTVTVTLRVDDPPRRLGQIGDAVDDGLEATGNHRSAALDEDQSYQLHLAERGVHTLGPIRVSVADLLGLTRQSFEYADATTTVTVTPRIRPLAVTALQRLARLSDLEIEPDRHEFDRLREYQPSDALRDIHWKTSAKRPDVDYIVKEFVREADRGTVVLSGEAVDGADDALADAMASVAVALAEAGVRVGLHTEAGSVDPIDRPEGVEGLIRHLATIGPGRPDGRGDIHFEAAGPDLREVRIAIRDRQLTMSEVLATEDVMGTRGRAGAVATMGVAD